MQELHHILAGRNRSWPLILIANQKKIFKQIMKREPSIDLLLTANKSPQSFSFLQMGMYLYNPTFAKIYHHDDPICIYVNDGSRYKGVQTTLLSDKAITIINLSSSSIIT